MNVTPVMLSECLTRMFEGMRICVEGIAAKHDLTKVQLFALYAIDRAKTEVPMSHVARHFGCDASNITGIVDRLVHHNLLTRTESSKDRRVKVVRLTKKGQTIINDLKSELPQRLGCTNLSANDREHLYTVLEKLNSYACTNYKIDNEAN